MEALVVIWILFVWWLWLVCMRLRRDAFTPDRSVHCIASLLREALTNMTECPPFLFCLQSPLRKIVKNIVEWAPKFCNVWYIFDAARTFLYPERSYWMLSESLWVISAFQGWLRTSQHQNGEASRRPFEVQVGPCFAELHVFSKCFWGMFFWQHLGDCKGRQKGFRLRESTFFTFAPISKKR